MAAVLISGPVSTRQEARTRARAREFSSDSLSAGARLAGRSHGLTPGWFCWPHRLSECTSRIIRREGFTPFDRVELRAAGSGECHCCSAAGSIPRNVPAALILHPLRLFGAFLSLHRQFVQEHALTQITRVETSGSRVVTPETEPFRRSPPPAFLEPPAASLRTPLSPNRAIPSSSRTLKSIELDPLITRPSCLPQQPSSLPPSHHVPPEARRSNHYQWFLPAPPTAGWSAP